MSMITNLQKSAHLFLCPLRRLQRRSGYYKEGAKKLMNLSSDSRVLIAECCTHAPLKEDIGREKIPRMLKKKYGETLKVTVVSGTDYPKDLTSYDLIIQCGACMFNRKYVLHRIQQAKNQGVAMTNYGVASLN